MKTKVSELTGIALDYAAAKAEGATDFHYDGVCCYWVTLNSQERVLSSGWAESMNFNPSTNWTQGGPIIARENLYVRPTGDAAKWSAYQWSDAKQNFSKAAYGSTPLIAAMRCYVASKLGDEVDVPDALLTPNQS